MGVIPLDLCRVSRQSRGHVDYSFGSLMGQASRLIALASAAIVLGILGQPVLADGARQQADKRDVKKQEFLKRLPLESRCKAEVTGGVVKPEGERNWKSGAFEVEPEDDFRVTILRLDQRSVMPRREAYFTMMFNAQATSKTEHSSACVVYSMIVVGLHS